MINGIFVLTIKLNHECRHDDRIIRYPNCTRFACWVSRERTHGRGRNIMMKVHDLSYISFPALVARSTGVFARVKYTNVMSRNERRTRGTVSVNSRARYLAKNTTILSYSSPRTEVHGWLSRCLQKKKK